MGPGHTVTPGRPVPSEEAKARKADLELPPRETTEDEVNQQATTEECDPFSRCPAMSLQQA